MPLLNNNSDVVNNKAINNINIKTHYKTHISVNTSLTSEEQKNENSIPPVDHLLGAQFGLHIKGLWIRYRVHKRMWDTFHRWPWSPILCMFTKK